MPDESRQAVELPCKCKASHIGCLALHLRRARTCPYCRRVARTEQTTPTDRWKNLVRVHNQHIQVNINAGGGIYTGIPPRSPRTPSPPIQEQQQQQHHHQQQQQQHHHHRQEQRRRAPQQLNDNRRYEISSIVCSRRSADGTSRELRIHWCRFAYALDTWESESSIQLQAPAIYECWLDAHVDGYTPPHDTIFPLRPADWMTTVKTGRATPLVESAYPGRNARRRLPVEDLIVLNDDDDDDDNNNNAIAPEADAEAMTVVVAEMEEPEMVIDEQVRDGSPGQPGQPVEEPVQLEEPEHVEDLIVLNDDDDDDNNNNNAIAPEADAEAMTVVVAEMEEPEMVFDEQVRDGSPGQPGQPVEEPVQLEEPEHEFDQNVRREDDQDVQPVHPGAPGHGGNRLPRNRGRKITGDERRRRKQMEEAPVSATVQHHHHHHHHHHYQQRSPFYPTPPNCFHPPPHPFPSHRSAPPPFPPHRQNFYFQ
uniref:Chromo domain-containing protein n=1 Tax=Globodera rostochiensis TaxID=31243 RepID=A0A914HP82_GLORO